MVFVDTCVLIDYSRGKISMNQFIATAIAKKLTALQTYDYLQEQADNGSAEHLLSMLKKVPDREAEVFDR